MKNSRPPIDPAVLSAAFMLVFRKGRSPPSCVAPNDTDLLNRIRDIVPAATPAACREALIRVRRLSFDVLELASAFCEAEYEERGDAGAFMLRELEDKDPGFSEDEYRTALAVGMIWTKLS